MYETVDIKLLIWTRAGLNINCQWTVLVKKIDSRLAHITLRRRKKTEADSLKVCSHLLKQADHQEVTEREVPGA